MKEHSMDQPASANGYSTIFAVVVLGAIGLSIVLSVLATSGLALRGASVLEHSYQSKALADACAEVVLSGLRLDENFTWPGEMTLGEGACDIVVLGEGDSNRIIQSTGVVREVTRRAEVQVSSLLPQISLTSWREVAGF